MKPNVPIHYKRIRHLAVLLYMTDAMSLTLSICSLSKQQFVGTMKLTGLSVGSLK